MPETTFQQREGQRFSCPKCGGGLIYDISSRKMKCDHCGELCPVPEDQAEQSDGGMMEVTEFRCPQCGAAVYSSATAMTSFCSFCGSDVVLTAKLSRTKRPAKIVPFTVTREQCENSYRAYLKPYHLAPEALKTTETISHFRPVYVPFWSYRVQGEGPVNVKGTKSYTKGNKRYDETYQLTWDAKVDRKGILYDASTVFEDETAALLEHTDDKAVPFEGAYLSGFYAQAADVTADAYKDEAAAAAAKDMLDRIAQATDLDNIESYAGAKGAYGVPDARITQELVMLPVWLLAHRQGGRVVYTAVNGSNGRVVCDVPVSNAKIVGIMAVIAVALFVLLQMFLTLRPDRLMGLCALLAMLTQFCFSGARDRLSARQERIYEPDFGGGNRPYVGPAQMLLDEQKRTPFPIKKILSGLLVAAVILFAVLPDSISAMIDRLENVTLNGLINVGVFAALVAMAVRVFRMRSKARLLTWLPSMAVLIATAAGLFCLLAGQVEDLVYYGCAAAVLAATIWELALINRAHNEYASRPVPYFDHQEEQK